MGSLTGSITDKQWGDFIEAWAKSEYADKELTAAEIVKHCCEWGFFTEFIQSRAPRRIATAMACFLRTRVGRTKRGYKLCQARIGCADRLVYYLCRSAAGSLKDMRDTAWRQLVELWADDEECRDRELTVKQIYDFCCQKGIEHCFANSRAGRARIGGLSSRLASESGKVTAGFMLHERFEPIGKRSVREVRKYRLKRVDETSNSQGELFDGPVNAKDKQEETAAPHPEPPVPCVSLEISEGKVLNLADFPKDPCDFFNAVLPMLKGCQVDAYSIRNGVFNKVVAIRFEKEWLPRKEGE